MTDKLHDQEYQRHYHMMGEALNFLLTSRELKPSLTEVADHVGLSPSHFQRLFTRWVGVSPKKFQGRLALDIAEAALMNGADVLDASLVAGLSGPSRLHDLYIVHEANTPGTVARRGMGLTIHYGVAPSPFGPAFVAVTEKGICAMSFIDPDLASDDIPTGRGAGSGMGDFNKQVSLLAKRFPKAALIHDDQVIAAFAAQAFAPLHDRTAPLPLYLEGTNFQIQVWKALLDIPEGGTATYGAIAEQVCEKNAARAVANAVSRNPIGFLVPCHRVLRETGALGGYYYGLDRKRAMLVWEKARAFNEHAN